MGTELARRDFLTRLAGSLAIASVAPAAALRATERARPRPVHLSLVGEDEAFWKTVRDQFPMRPGFIYLNAANLAPSPYVVSDTVADLTRDIDREMSGSSPSFASMAAQGWPSTSARTRKRSRSPEIPPRGTTRW
jgi:hypothetical protein